MPAKRSRPHPHNNQLSRRGYCEGSHAWWLRVCSVCLACVFRVFTSSWLSYSLLINKFINVEAFCSWLLQHAPGGSREQPNCFWRVTAVPIDLLLRNSSHLKLSASGYSRVFQGAPRMLLGARVAPACSYLLVINKLSKFEAFCSWLLQVAPGAAGRFPVAFALPG